jgi:hypothetical protein
VSCAYSKRRERNSSYCFCNSSGNLAMLAADLLPGREGSVGVTAADNRLFVEAVLCRYRTGMPWRDLPERGATRVEIKPITVPQPEWCNKAGRGRGRSDAERDHRSRRDDEATYSHRWAVTAVSAATT